MCRTIVVMPLVLYDQRKIWFFKFIGLTKKKTKSTDVQTDVENLIWVSSTCVN